MTSSAVKTWSTFNPLSTGVIIGRKQQITSKYLKCCDLYAEYIVKRTDRQVCIDPENGS